MANQLSMLEAICLSICANPKRSQRFILRVSYQCVHNTWSPSSGSNGSYWFASGKFNHLWSDISGRTIKHSRGGNRSYVSQLVLTEQGWNIMNQARIKLGFSPLTYYKE